MAYTPPYIDASGLHCNSYSDILAYYIQSYQGIYGADVYLGEDSSEYQEIAVEALRHYDLEQALQACYNARSPKTATGASLASLVKLNGLTPAVETYSTCVVTVAGNAGTVINAGVALDVNGNRWDLPVLVTIPIGGTIDVTATCETAGNIAALAGDISIIGTPTAGWTSVTNAAAATAGQAAELDASLRSRQSVSTQAPSHTMFAGTLAYIKAVSGVTRCKGYENDTAATVGALPPHSVTFVVEGGADADIAQAIFENRGIGPYTNGTTVVSVIDPDTGDAMDIRFFRPTDTPIYVALNVHPLTGYTAATAAAIKAAVAAYLNSLDIGDEVSVSAISAAAMSVTTLTSPLFTIPSGGVKIDDAPAPTAVIDIVIAYNAKASGDVANISITEV